MSDVYKKGYSPQTRAIHSSRNRLYATPGDSANGDSGKAVLGVVSNFSPTDSRDVEAVRGIGFGDQIAELVPQMSQAITITLTRTALYELNIFQALGYKGGLDGLVRALKHHRWPFDLRQEIVISDLQNLTATNLRSGLSPEDKPDQSNKSAISTLYAGCWITNYSTSYTADTAIIAEEVNLSVTDIFAVTASVQKELATDNSGRKANSVITSSTFSPR
jgi:hypothetical protein